MKASTASLLVCILLTAAALRFTALDFGEGRVNARPDEAAIPLTLMGMDGGILMPPLVIYGGGFFHPLRAFTWVAESLGVTGPEGDLVYPGARRTQIARWWSAILSLLTVGLTFVLGRQAAGTEAGLLASLIVATSALAVREAHFGKADSAAAFAALVFLLAAADSVKRDVPRAALVGVALGYAVSNKASVGLLVPTAYLFLRPFAQGCIREGTDWLRSPSSRPAWRALLGGALVSALTVVALNPHFLVHTTQALAFANVAVGNVSDNAWLAGADEALPPLQYHSQISLRWGGGLALALLTIPAVLWGVIRDPTSRLVTLAIVGPLTVFLSSPMVIARFMLPLIPPLAALTAVLVCDLVGRLPRKGRTLALVLAAVATTAEPAARARTLVHLLDQPDTRLLASDWLEANVAPDATLVSWGTPTRVHVDWGGVPAGKRKVHRNLAPSRWAASSVSHVIWHSYPLAYSSVTPPRALTRLEPVAVFEPFDGPVNAPVLEPMDAFYLPLGKLSGIARPGPRIAIYAVGADKS